MDVMKKRSSQQAKERSNANQSFETKESFSATGTVMIRPYRIGVEGERDYIEDGSFYSNLIVEIGRGSIIDLISGERRKELKHIRWGRGGAPSFPEGDPLLPYEVGDSDTDVDTQIIEKPLSSFVRLTATQLEYTETLTSDEVNDDVNEAGIFFEDTETGEKTMFARITFPTVRLLAERGTGIELKWVFNFDRSEELPVN